MFVHLKPRFILYLIRIKYGSKTPANQFFPFDEIGRNYCSEYLLVDLIKNIKLLAKKYRDGDLVKES